VAPGGQAGTTSMIENLLGFPAGIREPGGRLRHDQSTDLRS
jgi:hypothetical protein